MKVIWRVSFVSGNISIPRLAANGMRRMGVCSVLPNRLRGGVGVVETGGDGVPLSVCGITPIYSGRRSTPFGICGRIRPGHTGDRSTLFYSIIVRSSTLGSRRYGLLIDAGPVLREPVLHDSKILVESMTRPGFAAWAMQSAVAQVQSFLFSTQRSLGPIHCCRLIQPDNGQVQWRSC